MTHGKTQNRVVLPKHVGDVGSLFLSATCVIYMFLPKHADDIKFIFINNVSIPMTIHVFVRSMPMSLSLSLLMTCDFHEKRVFPSKYAEGVKLISLNKRVNHMGNPKSRFSSEVCRWREVYLSQQRADPHDNRVFSPKHADDVKACFFQQRAISHGKPKSQLI